MKHIKGVKIAVLVAVFAAIGGGKPLLADSETVGGVTWTYTVSDGVATITDQTGAAGVVDVPTALGGYVVKNLAAGLFIGNMAITEVRMPSVVYIGNRAFRECKNLVKVSMPVLERLGEDAFFVCSNLCCDLDLPMLTRIDQWGFQKSGVRSVVMPNLTQLALRGFEGCSSLTNVYMPKLNSIGVDAFLGCPNLTGDLHLPELTSVSDNAFRETGITSVYMPQVTSVGTNCFFKCLMLTNVVAPRITIVKKWGFQDCQTLRSISYMPQLTRVEYRAFQRCKQVTQFKLPLGVTVLEGEAFEGCSGLSEIAIHADSTLSDSVLKSGNSATVTRHGGTEDVGGVTWTFDALPDGTATILSQSGAAGAVTIPATLGGLPVTRIGTGVFYDNTDITSVQMPNIIEVGEKAFYRCGNLAGVVMPNVEIIGGNAFYDCVNLECDLDLPKLKFLGNWGFQQAGVKSANIPNVERIGFRAFDKCHSLTNAVIAEVREMGYEAFASCSNLVCAFDLPNLSEVSDGVFSATKVKSVNLPVAVRIGKNAFLNSALVRAEFPCVEWIGESSFQGTPLTHVDMPRLTDVGVNAFYQSRSMRSISTPRVKRVKAWGFQTVSSNFKELGYMPRLRSMDKRAFKDDTGLTQIKLSYRTDAAAYEPFMSCSRLTNIAIHAGSQLSEAVLKSGNSAVVTRYGGYADVNGVRWMYDDLPDDSVMVVGATGAAGDLEIPTRLNGKRVTAIETGAFEEYSGITSIKLASGIAVVGEEAFLNCFDLDVIRVLQTQTDLIASLRQEYGDDRVAAYAPGGTVIVVR